MPKMPLQLVRIKLNCLGKCQYFFIPMYNAKNAATICKFVLAATTGTNLVLAFTLL